MQAGQKDLTLMHQWLPAQTFFTHVSMGKWVQYRKHNFGVYYKSYIIRVHQLRFYSLSFFCIIKQISQAFNHDESIFH